MSFQEFPEVTETQTKVQQRYNYPLPADIEGYVQGHLPKHGSVYLCSSSSIINHPLPRLDPHRRAHFAAHHVALGPGAKERLRPFFFYYFAHQLPLDPPQ